MTAYLFDANVWLALALSTHPHHESTRRWLTSVEAPLSILFCRATQHAFLRLLTNKAMMAPFRDSPLTNREAWGVYDVFLADRRIALRAAEPIGVEPQWREYAGRASASPKLWMDAYLAAFARAGGYRMVTTDRAFRQFDGLDVLVLGSDDAEA